MSLLRNNKLRTRGLVVFSILIWATVATVSTAQKTSVLPDGNQEARRLNLFGTREPTESPTQTPTISRAASVVASTTAPTRAGLLRGEPKREYKPKKQLPPTVSPHPTSSPTLPVPTVSPTAVPSTLEPTQNPTRRQFVFSRAPTTPPSVAATVAPTSLIVSAPSAFQFPTGTLTTFPTAPPKPSASFPTGTLTRFPTAEPVPTVPPTTLAPTAEIVNQPPVPLSLGGLTRAPTPIGPQPAPWFGGGLTRAPTLLPTTQIEAQEDTVEPTQSPVTSPPTYLVGGWDGDDGTYPPTIARTSRPSRSPTKAPTEQPTSSPTKEPTASPTEEPTALPTETPTSSPTTHSPTKSPTSFPTLEPTTSPSPAPTTSPTTTPTSEPTMSPTVPIEDRETPSPTSMPSNVLTAGPTSMPSKSPTGSPIASQTVSPTAAPTLASMPTLIPTSIQPTAPSVQTPGNSPPSNMARTPAPSPTPTSSTDPPTSTGFPTVTGFPTNTWFPTDTGFPTATFFPTATTFPTSSAPPSWSTMNWREVQADYLYQSYNEEILGAALALSKDGEIVTVGGFMNSERAEGGGRVVRYDLSNNGASAEIYGLEQAYLGYQVSTSDDGRFLVTLDSNTGVFELVEYIPMASSFTPLARVEPEVFAGSADFALSGDGKWLAIVGENFDADTGETSILLFMYEYDEQNKQLNQYREPILFGQNESENWGYFDIAINHDGTFVVVSQVGQGDFIGEIHIYERLETSMSLKGEAFKSEGDNDGFGQAVEVLTIPSGDVVVGFSVPYEDIVYVYTLVTDKWVALGSPILATDVLADGTASEFGFDIAFSSAGDKMLIGAPAYRSARGAVQGFIFTDGEWLAFGDTLGGFEGSSFGEVVQCASDCSVIAIGAPLDCLDESTCGGSVYIYRDASISE